MKRILFTVVLCTCTMMVFSQRDVAKYKERAEEVRKEIWDNPEPQFKVKDVAAELKEESAVIIARYFEIVNSSKLKLKFSLFAPSARRLTYRTTIHERVRIGDKAALDEFSTIEYKKKLDKTASYAFTKIYDKMESYIGAKIIKPDGKEIIVNTEEEVLTKNKSKDKEGKLAISDLQVGDILDYYIRIEETQETGAEAQGPYSFVMGGEYPLLHMKVRLQLDDKVNVKYITANGAPSFRETTTDDGDILLELTQKNLPKFESKMWTSAWRQWPYIILTYTYVGRKGEVKKGFMSDELVKTMKNNILPYMGTNINWAPLNHTYDYFGGKKKIKDFPADTVVKVLYDAWKFSTFCTFNTENIDITNDLNYTTANSLMGAISLSYFLRALEIDHDIVLTCSRFSASIKNVMSLGDFDGLIRLKNGKQWMAFDDIVTQFNEIPQRFQGEDAITLHPEVLRKSVEYYESKTRIPVTRDVENAITEDITVSLASPNMQQIKIDRTCSLTGAMRHGEQKRLLLMEDMDAELAKAINQKKLADRLADNKKSQKVVVEFTAAFDKEKKELKNYFKDEAKEQFEEEPKDLTVFEVKSKALLRNEPEFQYRSTFSLDNFVKKAGNNFIVDAGRLIGKFSKIEDKERKRTIDVYMSCPRVFVYNVSLNVPEGYIVKGVEDLAKTVSNEVGSFSVTASSDGKVVKMSVKRTFTRNFEPAANWVKLVELLDAVYEFNNKKILLEKKK